MGTDITEFAFKQKKVVALDRSMLKLTLDENRYDGAAEKCDLNEHVDSILASSAMNNTLGSQPEVQPFSSSPLSEPNKNSVLKLRRR